MSGPQGWVPGPDAHFAREGGFEPAGLLLARIQKLEAEAEAFKQAVYSAAFRDMAHAIANIRPVDNDPVDPAGSRFPRGTVMDHYLRTIDQLHDEPERNFAEETLHQFTRARPLGNMTIGQRYRTIRAADSLAEFTQNEDPRQLGAAFQDFAQVISAYIPAAHFSQIATNAIQKFVDARVQEILTAKFEALQAETDKRISALESEKLALKTPQAQDRVFKNEVSSRVNDPEDLHRSGWISQESPFVEGA